MKSGQTEYWRFPIMGEETWAGVAARRAATPVSSNFHSMRRSDHVTQTQKYTQFTQIQP
jgi:hypothetical protein